jgi:hypothetical protein
MDLDFGDALLRFTTARSHDSLKYRNEELPFDDLKRGDAEACEQLWATVCNTIEAKRQKKE